MKILVFDVESVGLTGDPFSVGYVAWDGEKVAEEGIRSCELEYCEGTNYDRDWVLANVPPLPADCVRPEHLHVWFQMVVARFAGLGYLFAAEIPYPVETNFLSGAGISIYPLIDIASVILAKGGDPLATRERAANELPVHNPLCDARQSLRLFLEAMNETA